MTEKEFLEKYGNENFTFEALKKTRIEYKSEKLGISKNELKIFLNFYCRSKKYRANLIFNTERINLKGEVVGLVKEEEATYHLK